MAILGFSIVQVCNELAEISRRQAVGRGGTHSAQFLNYMLFIEIFPKLKLQIKKN